MDKSSSGLSLEYPMQAITLLVVVAVTFALMLAWTKYKKRKRK
ncbi:hypothetical protein MJA45_19655 [Paenibacillus aurantius]|uniref:Uncharacterized protein n=1 Tax=Paenibacillus aurantius TaxID=2918900 RepID=A0AA96LCY8_9BACL|nr:hypothetical protein [Paenibacillus aurantius]WJH34611.1 hypothetical protein N6H14_33425 [Paenibacillus sp. CC-CFT747]WNQ09826.1 hypothetical protein MJA45_19655 [Paenibacillus aurantius]